MSRSRVFRALAVGCTGVGPLLLPLNSQAQDDELCFCLSRLMVVQGTEYPVPMVRLFLGTVILHGFPCGCWLRLTIALAKLPGKP